MAEFPKLPIYDIDDLVSELGSVKIKKFTKACEDDFLQRLRTLAYDAAWDNNVKIIFVSGPTSSGKTTFTKRLASALELYGRESTMLSMDDYYLAEKNIYTAEGMPNFESIDNLDLTGMADDIRSLLDGKETNLPHFDLKLRKRVKDSSRVFTLSTKGILLVEGLHALNPLLQEKLKREEYLTIFIMPYASLMNSGRALDSEDCRIMRRLSRDLHHRGANPFATIDYWPVIHMEEAKVFPDYLARADFYINSILPYEYLIIPGIAAKYLEADLALYEKGELVRSVFLQNSINLEKRDYFDIEKTVAEAKRLLKISKELPFIDPSYVPDISLLNEFIK